MEMNNIIFAFGVLILFSAVEFRTTRSLIVRESYEIFEEYGKNEEMFEEIVRRDTREQSEPTTRPGVETEQRPPILPPVNPTRSPTVITSTQPPSKKSAGSASTTNAPTTASNHNVNDHHRYYKSTYENSGANKRWYPLNRRVAVVHEKLSKNQQYSDTIPTSFKFPYYGHFIDYVTITNKGYLFLGDVVHKFNATSQYVAPLMADFTTNNDTRIAYVDTGDRLTVEWANLTFHDRKVGDFSFQCTIMKNGTLIFAYRNIPAPVVELKSSSLQQRVGISDSLRYRILRHGLFVIRGRIYTTIVHNYYFKYHSVDLPMENVKSGSAYVITPVINCVMLESCNACVGTKTAFSCVWCPTLKRCSDGVDRHRQQWFRNRCPTNNQTTCPAPTTMQDINVTTTLNPVSTSDGQTKTNSTKDSQGSSSKNPTTKTASKTDPTINPREEPTYTQVPTRARTTKAVPMIPTSKTIKPTEKATDNTTLSSKTTTKVSNSVTVASPEKKTATNARPTKTSNPGIKNNKPLNIQANQGARSGSRSSSVSDVGVAFIVLSLVIILAAICWFVYAYRHPQTKSGRFLIEHRNPKKWFRNDDGTSGKVHYKTKTMELSES